MASHSAPYLLQANPHSTRTLVGSAMVKFVISKISTNLGFRNILLYVSPLVRLDWPPVKAETMKILS